LDVATKQYVDGLTGAWGLTSQGGAVYPATKASTSDVASGNVVVVASELNGSSIKIDADSDGNLVTMCSTTLGIVGTSAAGSTTYTLKDSNCTLPDGTYDYFLDYYFTMEGENTVAQKPTSVTLNSSNQPVLTFASSLNPSASGTHLQYGANFASAKGIISSAGGVHCTKSWNVLVGNLITSKG
jgi:hypothetical protein